MSTREKLLSWNMSRVSTTKRNSGTPALTEALALGAVLDRAAGLQQVAGRQRAQRLQGRFDLRRWSAVAAGRRCRRAR